NAKGQTIPPAWRYVVALTDSACLKAAKANYEHLLTTYDWDGVNLAELYFESPVGSADAATFNPMHQSARDQFHKLAGFDPALLMDPASGLYWKTHGWALKKFQEYRVQTIVRLHREFLESIENVKQQKPYLDVVVTTMDNLGSTELRPNLGVDVREIAALRSAYRFRLQIQD